MKIFLAFVLFLYVSATESNSSVVQILKSDPERDRENISSIIPQRRLACRVKDDAPINVLSIDGGGVRGIIPAVFLEKLEKESGKKVNQLFDLVVGTSTGGILALGLTTEKTSGIFRSALDMKGIYETLSSKIFSTRSMIRRFLESFLTYFWYGSWYSEKPLESVLDSEFPGKTLRDVRVPTVITSVRVGSNSLRLFRSYRANWNPDENFSLKDVGRATSAAPAYFPMKKVSPVGNKSSFENLIDGGVAANNPSAIAYAEAVSLFPGRKINLISLSTGEVTSQTNDRVRDTSAIRRIIPIWGSSIMDMMFSAQSDSVHQTLYNLKDSIGGLKYKRVKLSLTKELEPLDKASNIGRLANTMYSQLAHEQRSKLKKITNILMDSRFN